MKPLLITLLLVETTALALIALALNEARRLFEREAG